jgi:hypothetical protein
MPEKSPTALFVVPRTGAHGDVPTVAIVKATVDRKEMTGVCTFLAALKKAVTAWIDSDKDGVSAWIESSGFFNVGDMSQWLGSRSLIRRLKKEGIFKINIDVTDVPTGTRVWTFDTVLYEED